MKLCFPVAINNGMASIPYGHFGSAPMFLLVDTEANESSVLGNKDSGHEHGACQPVSMLDGNKVDAIIVGGIGGGAIAKLNAAGIKVYRAGDGNIEHNVALFKSNQLPLLTMNNACSHHSHECGH